MMHFYINIRATDYTALEEIGLGEFTVSDPFN
jgi:hypothetical protein